jgi:hypothetical protein
MFDRMLNLKSAIQQLYYDELKDDDKKANSTIAKCVLTTDNWECLANVKHVSESFKEGQKTCEAHRYVYLSLVPIFVKTIHHELMVLAEEMKLENVVPPFLEGSNKAGLWSLISRMVTTFKQRWGTRE